MPLLVLHWSWMQECGGGISPRPSRGENPLPCPAAHVLGSQFLGSDSQSWVMGELLANQCLQVLLLRVFFKANKKTLAVPICLPQSKLLIIQAQRTYDHKHFKILSYKLAHNARVSQTSYFTQHAKQVLVQHDDSSGWYLPQSSIIKAIYYRKHHVLYL